MNKRLLSLLLVAAMTLSMINLTVFAAPAADTAVVAVSAVSTELAVGSTVSVPVHLTQNPGIAQALMTVSWDKTAMTLVDIDFTEGLPDKYSQPLQDAGEQISKGSYRISLGDHLSTENYTGEGEVLVTLTFEILSGAEAGTYAVRLSNPDFLDCDIHAVPVEFVNGSVTLLPPAVKHAQEIPAGTWADDNLWTILTPEEGYFKGAVWTDKYYSITFPVEEGDRIASNSFNKKPDNGNTSSSTNGIAVSFLDANEQLVSSMAPQDVCDEYLAHGYITVPAGAVYVCVPQWKNNAQSEVYLLTLPKRIASAELTVAAPVTAEAPQTTLEGDGFTGAVTWSPAVSDVFAANTVYTAEITLTADAGNKFTLDFAATVNGEAVTFTRSADGTTATGSVTFPATAILEIESAELTVAAPVAGKAPQTTLEGTGFTGTVTWSPEVDGKFAFNTAYTAVIALTAEADSYKFASGFTATVNGEAVTFEVDAEGTTATGSVTFAKTQTQLDGHLQEIPDGTYADDNLWKVLTPEKQYFTSTGWSTKYYSITFPVEAGDRVYASSFRDKSQNGSPSNRDGIVVGYFYEDGSAEMISFTEVYAEYVANGGDNGGYLVMPEGIAAICVPMWKNNADSVVNLLTLPKRVASAELTVAAPVTGEAPQTALEGDGFTGAITWSPEVSDVFAIDTVYTANITLTAKADYTFLADFAATVNGEAVTFEVNAEGTAATGSVTFPATAYLEIESAELTVAAPVTGEAPQTALTGTGFTGTITWSPEVDGTFAPAAAYTANITLTAEADYKFASGFTATVGGEAVTFEVNAEGTTAAGSVTFAKTAPMHGSHIQPIPEGTYNDDNLWKVLTPEKLYYKSDELGWVSNYYSITFPVQEGDRIYASSFEAKGENGSDNRYGIVVSFFNEKGEMIWHPGPTDKATSDGTYAEFVKNGGYLIAPEGTAFVNIPMWKNNADATVYLLTLPSRPGTGSELSGTVESFGDAEDVVTIEVWKDERLVASTTTTDGTYALSGLTADTYTVKFGKAYHITRSYSVEINGTSAILDGKICLRGDATQDGAVNITDVSRVFAHVKGRTITDAYAYACADAVGTDGSVNITDVSRLFAHVKGRPLF